MSEDRPTDLLAALPRTRPHRRSAKRDARPAMSKPGGASRAEPAARKPTGRASTPRAGRKTRSRPSSKPLRQPAQPRGIPNARRAPKRKPAPATGAEIVGTAFQAVGELAELGLALSARALRNAASRVPRP